VASARIWLPVLGAMVFGTAAQARAHIRMTAPTARHDQLKLGPCGAGPDDPRGTNVHTFRPGQALTLTWEETVDHPGHYRIAFDEDGQDDFVDPKSFDDRSGGPGVLVDGIPDRAGGGTYSQEVTLPDVECDNCTIQVIQMMTDKPPYASGGNDLYYQCIDVVLRADAPEDPTGAPATPSDEEGCDCRGEGGSPLALLLVAGLRRRRRA
jgi:hypothetical protein